MVKKIYVYFAAAVMTLSVLLCGCGEESAGDVILIGSAGTDAGYSDAGTPENPQPGTAASELPGNPQTGNAASELPGNPQTGGSVTELPAVRVYVCGAVVCPGVVEIPQGSRIEDALSAAGGFLPDALAEAVNLAEWVSDGQMLYFPTKEEAEVWSPARESRGVLNEREALVNINTAGAALLCTLPGIGEAKAADIIAYREAHGGFASCEDIMKVPGIKTNIYGKICDKITVK